jgi:predicted ribosomally synthesized peptide with nif11-like leader
VDPQATSMSKAQLSAFLSEVEADPALKLRVEAAADARAVVLIGQESGHVFSAATLARHLRG